MKFDFGVFNVKTLLSKVSKYFGNFGYNYMKEKISDYTIYGVGDFLKQKLESEIDSEYQKMLSAVEDLNTKSEFKDYLESYYNDLNKNYFDKIDEYMKEIDEKI